MVWTLSSSSFAYPGLGFLCTSLPRSSWQWGLGSPKKHLLAGPSSGDNDSLQAWIESTPCLLFSVPRHSQLSWIHTALMTNVSRFSPQLSALVSLSSSIWIWWTELNDCFSLMFSYSRGTCAFHNLLLLEYYQHNLKKLQKWWITG